MIFNKADTLTTERTFSETQTGNTTGYRYLASIQRNLSSILKKEKKKKKAHFATINRMCIQNKHAHLYNSVILALKLVPSQRNNSVIFFLYYAKITSESSKHQLVSSSD